MQVTYFTASALVKTSILLLYRRIFGVCPRFRITIYVCQTLVACYFVICLLLCIFGCKPVSYFWNKDQAGSCFDETQFFRWNGVTSLLLDILILALPLPMIWRLRLKQEQKVALSGIFMLGGLYVFSLSVFTSCVSRDITC